MQEAIPFNIFENNKLVNIEEPIQFPTDNYGDKSVLIYLLPYQNIDEHRPQLEKIFAACKKSSEALLTVNQGLDWASIQKLDGIKEVFLFGINPKNIGIAYTLFPYKFLSISEKKVVLADPLDLIMGQAQLKNDFWHNCLKPYYIGA